MQSFFSTKCRQTWCTFIFYFSRKFSRLFFSLFLQKVDFVCQEDGYCSVTYESRRICGCCRLAKCFRVGMKRSLILSDAEREARKELVHRNRLKRAQEFMKYHTDTVRFDSMKRDFL